MGHEVRISAILVFLVALSGCGNLDESNLEESNLEEFSGENLPTTLVESIDRLVSQYPTPSQENLNVFRSYSATPGQADLQAEWNPDGWGAEVNLSPIAWHDTWTNADGYGPTLGRGVAVTRRHVIAHHQHGTEAPGRTLQFVRRNGEIVTRMAAAEYEVDTSTYWRVLYLDSDLPEDMVAPLPTTNSVIAGKPIANLNQFHELRLQLVNSAVMNSSHVSVNGLRDSDPIRSLYFRAPISGDSGKPLFAIIGNEMVPLSFWWTTGGGSSIIFDQATIVQAIDRLSVRKSDTRLLQPRFVEVK